MLSIIDALALVQEDGMYVYNKNYERITEKTVDHGTFNEYDEEHITPISGLVVSEDKLNLSIMNVVKGYVQLDSTKAREVNLPEKVEVVKFRNQAIVKNGKAHMDTITLLVNKELLKILVQYRVPFRVINESESYKNKLYARIEMDLTKMEVVSEESETLTTKEILDLVDRRDKLIMKQKVVKRYIEDAQSDRSEETRFMGGGYTISQIEVLKEHGIDSKGYYVGVNTEKVKDESRFYIARNIEFQLKGQASLPSFNEVNKRIVSGKKLNSITEYTKEMMEAYKDNSLADLEEIYTLIKEELGRVKLRLARERFYRVIRNVSDFDGVDLDAKGNMNYTDGDKTLVIKIKNEKVYY